MTMKSFAVVALLSSLVSADMAVNPSSVTSMSRSEQAAFREVSLYCENDVERYCTRGDSLFADLFFMAPPPFEEMESFIDNMIQSTLRMPFESSSFLLIIEDGSPPSQPMEHHAVEHVLTEIAGQTPPEQVPAAAQRIAEHGSLLLEDQSQDETQVRVARRLSEVTPEELHQRQQALLPFSAAQTECLRSHYSQARLSISCGRALFRLEKLRDAQYSANVQFQEDRAVVMVNLLCLYALVLATGLVIYYRRRKDLRAKRRLTRKIFQAIYSSPQLKHAVEKEMGESVGHLPPLSTGTLWRMGLIGQKIRGAFEVCRWMRMVFVTIVSICFVLAPLSTLPVVVGYAAAVFWCAVFSPKPTEICACCCCEATTESAKNGTLTAEQECCACCKGTGVCCVQCASCCGDKGDEDDGCCCPKNDQVGCCCCCCGGDGKVNGGCCGGCCCSTDKASGCCGTCCDGCCCCSTDKTSGCCGTCCQGAGCGSCCCCSGTCCCCAACCSAKKEKSEPQMVVYEGVPMQIV
uniref:Uncharacterized protein n=1 Tax=Amphora coffeiformis TaxID=265554 RepID=A0A7S3L1V6_9STRA